MLRSNKVRPQAARRKETGLDRTENSSVVTLGLIPAPDISEKMAKELPELLARHVDATPSWNVPVVVDPLTGSGREAPEILDVCHERMLKEGWDFAICFTDLPVYRGERLVFALPWQRSQGSNSGIHKY